jgi:hypothetical protein
VPYRHWTFTIPKAIRGLFERERRLLGLLSRTAYDSIRKSFQTLFVRKDVRPGCVISIQSFGSFGANFHPVGSKNSTEQQVAEPTNLAIISAICLGQLTGTHRSRMLHVFTPAFGGI